MTDYFIGDTHFGHKNIITFEAEKRPFRNIEEMNEVLVDNWNSVVNKGDRVFHLGDFCFGSKNLDTAAKLNGTKYLIMGNHDTLPSAAYLNHFHKLLGSLQYKKCILTHIPIHEYQFYRFLVNIHGHMHSKSMDDPRYINVSVEHTDLKPISWEDLKESNIILRD